MQGKHKLGHDELLNSYIMNKNMNIDMNKDMNKDMNMNMSMNKSMSYLVTGQRHMYILPMTRHCREILKIFETMKRLFAFKVEVYGDEATLLFQNVKF